MTDVSMPDAAAQNVQLVRDLYAAFVRRDIAAILAVLSPEVDWGEPENPFNPSAGTRHGHEGFLEWVPTGNQAEEVLASSQDNFSLERTPSRSSVIRPAAPSQPARPTKPILSMWSPSNRDGSHASRVL
jgi:hypothetical protein